MMKARKHHNIRGRFLFSLGLSLAVLIVVFLLWMKGIHEERIQYEAFRSVNAAKTLYESNMEVRKLRLITSLKMILNNHDLASLFAKEDRKTLLMQSKPLFELLKEDGITHFYFHRVDQHVLLRVHQPNHHSDHIKRQTLVQAVSTKRVTTGIELGSLGTLSLRSVSPWYQEGRLIGYLELGIEVSQLLLAIHELQNMEVTTFLFKRHLERRSWLAGQKMLNREGHWGLLRDKVIVGSSLAQFPSSLLELWNDRLDHQTHGFIFDQERIYYKFSFDIYDINQKLVAEVLLLYDISEVYSSSNQELAMSGATLALLAIVLLLSLWFMLGHLERQIRREIAARVLLEDQHIESISKQNKRLLDNEVKLKTHVEKMHLAQLASLNMMQDIEHGRKVAEDALKAKSRFLAMMSHEIRTPLNGVLGLSELLLDGRLNQLQREHVQAIFSSGHTLLTILNDVLDFSKMEVEQLKLNEIPMQLNDMIEHVAKLFSASIHHKNLNFSCAGVPLLNHFLLGDPDRIQQILMNLVSNALKFTSEGEVAMRCLLEHETEHSMTFRFEVVDTGIGIATSQQEKLFEEFFQIDSSHTRQHGGTGLGLAICNNLVSLMGSQLCVKSTSGIGSTFFFSLKLKKGELLPDSALAYREQFMQWRALVVDDYETNRTVMQHLSTAWGMQSSAVDSGEKALCVLEDAVKNNEPFDLVFLDQMMPEMDGLLLARKIRENPKLSSLKLILLSSLDDAVNDHNMHELGLDAYLRKPVHQTALFKLVLHAMSASTHLMEEGASQHGDTSPFLAIRDESLLLAEDVFINQQVVLGMLKKLGFVHVDVANNGREAIEMHQKKAYDLILMDIQMPHMNGYEATKLIRAHEPLSGMKVPIIGLSAHAFIEDRQHALNVGMSDYLAKPISGNALSQIMIQYLPPLLNQEKRPKERGVVIEEKQPFMSDEVNSRCVLSKAVLQRLYQDLNGPIGEVIDAFAHELSKQQIIMKKSLDAVDLDALRRSAHRLKGSSGNLGALQLSTQCSELEQSVKNNETPSSEQLAVTLHAIDAVREALKEPWVQKLR